MCACSRFPVRVWLGTDNHWFSKCRLDPFGLLMVHGWGSGMSAGSPLDDSCGKPMIYQRFVPISIYVVIYQRWLINDYYRFGICVDVLINSFSHDIRVNQVNLKLLNVLNFNNFGDSSHLTYNPVDFQVLFRVHRTPSLLSPLTSSWPHITLRVSNAAMLLTTPICKLLIVVVTHADAVC